MLGRLNHVAIAVKDAEKAARIYGTALGAEISAADSAANEKSGAAPRLV